MKKFVILAIAIASIAPIAAQDDVRTSSDSVQTLHEVVVTGTRAESDVRHLPMTVTVVGRDKLTEQQTPNLLPAVMEAVPGLMVTSRGMMGYGVSTGAAGGLSLRGISGSAGQMLVLIDGHPQYNGIYGHPISDSYQTMMAERVEVVRGPASLLYGSNAMGGVLNIVTREMREDGARFNLRLGAGSYGTVQTEVNSQVRKGRFSSTIAAQYGRSDNHRSNMGFEQQGGYLKLGYDLGSHWNIYADIDLLHFNASNPGPDSLPKLMNDQWITRGAASVVLKNRYQRTSGALSIYDNFGRHKINDGYNEGGTPQTDLFRSNDAVYGLSWYQTASLFDGNHITVGFDYQHIYGHAYYTDLVTDTIVTTPKRLKQSADEDADDVAGYVDFRQDVASWLTVDLGLRYDQHSVAGGEWVPQAGLVWRPLSNGEAKLMMGKGFRNPTTREMYMYGTANHDSLHAESLMNYELAWRQRLLDGRLTYGLNLYYLKGANMIQVVGGRNVNTGEIENYGAELAADYRIGSHWAVSTNHSLLHMEHKVVAAPEYKGYLGANYRLGALSVNAGLQYLHNLYTAVGGTETKESVCLLNLTASYAVGQHVELWLRGENLLGQEYEFNLGYPMPRATFMGGVNIRM